MSRPLAAHAAGPRYVASVGERVYVEGPELRPIGPDVWLRQTQSGGTGLALQAPPMADEAVLVEVPTRKSTSRTSRFWIGNGDASGHRD